MTNWKEYKLSDLMDVIGGGTPKTTIPEYWNGNIPWLSVVDFGNAEKRVFDTEKKITDLGLNNSSTKILKKGQIIISARGTVGELAVLGQDMAFNQSCYGLNAKSEICTNDFLYYLMKCKISELKRNAHGAVFDTITRNTFETISASVPDIDTQTAIAEILSSLDDKIELNNKINQELENLAQTLFKQWFIDFEFPNENGEPYKSSGGEMVESELGEIPKGWEVICFKDTIEKYIDNRGKTPPVISDGIPIVEVKHMSDSSIFPSLKTQKFVSQEVYENWFRAYLEQDDLLMSTVGTIGRLNITPKNEIFAIAQNVLGLRFKKEILTQHYMFCLMRSKLFNDEINSRLIITVQASIKRSDLEKIPVIIPDYSMLKQFDIQVRILFDEITNLTKENQELTLLRDTLLPKLISGELEVNGLNLDSLDLLDEKDFKKKADNNQGNQDNLNNQGSDK